MVPIVAVEEIVRGRLNAIRQAESGKGRITVEQAYILFEQTLKDLRELRVLSFTAEADRLLQEWRQKKIKGATHDLRIAASCVVNSTTLVTRNRPALQGHSRSIGGILGLTRQITYCATGDLFRS
jgi:predicted nucleic acid-binding protein